MAVPSRPPRADGRVLGIRLGTAARLWDTAPGLRGHDVLGILVLAGLYYGAAKLGYELDFAGPVAAIVWFPAGVGIAFLCIGGLRFWPGVLIGDLLANDYGALPLGSALAQTAGNVAEVVVAVVLMHRFVRRSSVLDTVPALGGMVAALAIGTAVSATVGSLAQLVGDVVAFSALPTVWRTWWLGDLSGALVVVPLALAWYKAPPRSWTSGRIGEAGLMLAAVAGTSQLAFRGDRPLAYLAFPALLWAALRFGRRGATLAVAIAVAFAVWNTTHYHGPFVFHDITLSVLAAQLYIAVASLTTLCLAAVVSEREAFADGLEASRARLVKASDTERRRLEHNLHDGAQQRLSALATRLGTAAEHAREEGDPAAGVLGEAETEVTEAIDELRELAHGIHPAVLTDLGLAAAVRSVAARSSVAVIVAGLPKGRFDDTAEATAYYLFAEALTNAQKHAHASSVRVLASAVDDHLSIEVADDGIGGARETSGGGLNGLRDRIEAVGGSFAVDSVDGRGTRVTAEIPAVAVGP